MVEQELEQSPLGQRSLYVTSYDPTLLFPIAREPKRQVMGLKDPLPFHGYDLWTAFELSWLNEKCKPVVAVADIIIPCNSPNLVESKSFKLYLNSFNNTCFNSSAEVGKTISRDLSEIIGSSVEVTLSSPQEYTNSPPGQFNGFYLDELDISCLEYQVNANLLKAGEGLVKDCTLFSHLLKSNCPVTRQPDWGSVSICYTGTRIDEASLLRYLVSFRNHNEFHEQCVERIFVDLLAHFNLDELTVYARYTRRGGLDINPIRSTKVIEPPKNIRLYRQEVEVEND